MPNRRKEDLKKWKKEFAAVVQKVQTVDGERDTIRRKRKDVVEKQMAKQARKRKEYFEEVWSKKCVLDAWTAVKEACAHERFVELYEEMEGHGFQVDDRNECKFVAVCRVSVAS